MTRSAPFCALRAVAPCWGVLAVSVMAAATPLNAEIILPDRAQQTARIERANGSYALPIGPWAAGKVDSLDLDGPVEHGSWRVPGKGADTLAVMQSLSGQLVRDGYEILFSCDTNACGGFDFRYATKVVPEPEMHVDLGDFRFSSAKKQTSGGTDYVGLLISRAGDTAFVQLSHVGRGDVIGAQTAIAAPATDVPAAVPTDTLDPAPATSAADQLDYEGRFTLEDLDFASGATELGPGPFDSLKALAAYLASHPDRTVIVVGHTDASGPLAVNVALSRQRAQSVVNRLVADWGADPNQISADGVGFLSPRASNLTEAGRRKNRRVEAVLASTR